MPYSWLNRGGKRKSQPVIRKEKTFARTVFRPELEPLEMRLAPATHTWDGSASDLWSNADNWVENSQPSAGEANLVLVFPAGALNPSNRNNIPGLTVQTITFSGSGYTLGSQGGGKNISLTGGITLDAGVTGTNVVNLNIQLREEQSISVTDSGAELDLEGVISSSGAFNLIKDGDGTLSFTGSSSNTYGGITIVEEGILLLNKSGANKIAVPGYLTIGDGTGTDIVRLGADDQIEDLSVVTITSSGQLDLNNHSDKIGPLAMTGGLVPTVQTGTGTLTLFSNVTTNASSVPAEIRGKLNLDGVLRTFIVPDGGASSDLLISAVVSNGGIAKAGAGKLVLTGTNTYAGATAVNAGILDIQNASALGTSVGGTSVADGATLQVEGGITLNEPLTLSGKGVGNVGALESLSGVNTLTGPVTLTATTANPGVYVGVDANQLAINGVVSGTGGLTKVGTDELILGGTAANTFAGATRVLSGPLTLNKTAGIVAVPHALVVGDGAGNGTVTLAADNQIAGSAAVTIAAGTLDLNGHAQTIGTLAMTAGQVTTGSGILTLAGNIATTAVSTSATISGNLNLGGTTRTITVANGPATDDLLISAIISNGGLIKAGAGQLTLTGTNSYAGATSIKAGVLQIQNASALGATTAGTAMAEGASLQLNNASVTGETLSLAGKGVGNLGALESVAGTNTWDGSITLTLTTTNPNVYIGVDSGSLNLSGTIKGTAGLVKVGPGTLQLSGNTSNTYAGLTTVTDGLLELNKSQVPATHLAIPHSLVIGNTVGTDQVRLLGNDQLADTGAIYLTSSGTLDLNNFSDKVAALVFTGGLVATGSGTLTLGGNVTSKVASGPAQITGNLNLGGITRAFSIAKGTGSSDLDISAIISNGGLTKLGTGRLSLQGTNTYAGVTSVAAGILVMQNSSALGSTALGTVVAADASLQVQGVNVSGETLRLSGTGVGNSGALDEKLGGNTWTGPITLLATLTRPYVGIGVDSGTFIVDGILSGSAGLIKFGSGILQTTGSSGNTYLGPTRVYQGTLDLNKSVGLAVPKSLIVGDGVGGTNADIVRLLANDQLSNTAAIQINGSGQLILNSVSDTIGPLTLVGGNVQVTGGTLTLNGNVMTLASANTATISGLLNLGSASRTFNVANGAASIDLQVSASISGSAGLAKTGAGKLVLDGINSYTGSTAVAAGVLNIRNASALGTTAAGTSVVAGAILQLENGIPVGAETLKLTGTARLENVNGSNSWAGSITLTATSTSPSISINVTADNLNLSGVINGTGGLTKIGTGVLELSGTSANTFAGTTRVNAGKLVLNKTGVNAIPRNLVIGDGLGGSQADIVQWLSGNQVADAATIVLNSSGLLDLGGFAETIHALVNKGGTLLNANNLTIV